MYFVAISSRDPVINYIHYWILLYDEKKKNSNVSKDYIEI